MGALLTFCWRALCVCLCACIVSVLQFVSFADSDAPPGQRPSQLWMRVPYTDPKDGMPLTFVEVQSARGPAGRVYRLKNVFGGSVKGWVTYEQDGDSQWFHASVSLILSASFSLQQLLWGHQASHLHAHPCHYVSVIVSINVRWWCLPCKQTERRQRRH